uniref:BAR domain-containing protein n=1 Tax=Steinernema glaseri TaxID=37863 RepID=A0A1I7Y5U3_9BILA
MSLLQLNEKISEHLKAIDDLAEVKPMPKIIQLHFKEIKAYFEQYVETSEKCRRRCDELREIKERQKRTITDLTEDEESLGASMEDKCANDVQMPLLELNEKISEHLDAIDVFSAKNPIPKFIQLHFKEIKEFFEQCVEFSKNMGLPTHFNSSTEVGKVGEENLAGDSPASEAPAEEEIDMELEKEFPKVYR